jgi:predicted  nucleic acid-binding Zn-ribbon protein
MKSGNIFLIFFLFFSIRALEPTEKSFLSLTKPTNSFLQHSRLGNIILSFAQMSTTDDQFNGLYDALDTLLSSLEDQITSENGTFSQSSDLHESAVDTLDQQISDVTNDLNTAQDYLNSTLYIQLSDIEADIDSVTQSIQDYQSQIVDLQTQRAAQQESNSQSILDFTEAINAVDDAIGLLRSLGGSSIDGSSFIQKRFEDIAQTKNLLKLSVSRVKHSFYVDTLVQTLSYLGDKNFVDQETLKKVVNLLKELRDSFETEKKSVADFDDQQQLLYENQVKAINDAIDAQNQALDLDNSELNDVKCKYNGVFKGD